MHYRFWGLLDSCLAASAVELEQPGKAAALLDKLRVAAEKIDEARNKADTLQALAQIVNEPGFLIDKTQWLNSLGNSARAVNDSAERDSVWLILTEQAALLGNWSQARDFADQIGSESAKIDAFSRILQAWGAFKSKDHT